MKTLFQRIIAKIKENKDKVRPKKETSKRILFYTGLMFASQIFGAMIFVWYTKPTDIFIYTVPATGGILGSAIIFYLNKAKIENIFKGKIEFLKLKLELLSTCENDAQKEAVENDISGVDTALDGKINDVMNDAVQEEIAVNGNV